MKAIEHQLLIENVNDHVEKKNNLSYLSWAWAWAEALKADPAATFHVRTFSVNGVEQCFMNLNGTAMVWVMVTIGDRSRECFLPVMDHRNKPISDPDAFQINTALMRCLTKCLALFGLGLYIYAGEDLPEVAEVKNEPDAQENLRFFAEKLVENISMHNSEKALREYWKANLEGIENLKKQLPDVFKAVLEKFAQAKKEANDAQSS